MTDEKFCFVQDLRERKNLARQASHRVNGSKSKSCDLPQDFLSPAELAERNSRITMNPLKLDEPMRWKAFKMLVEEQQVEYLCHVNECYGPLTARALGDLFGVSQSTIHKMGPAEKEVFAKAGISFEKGVRLDPAKRSAWEQFLGHGTENPDAVAMEPGFPVSESVAEAFEVEELPSVSKPEGIVTNAERQEETLALKELDVTFEGVTFDQIAAVVRNVFGPKKGRFTITFREEAKK